MEENEFIAFIELLRLLKKEDLDRKNVNNAIMDIIDFYNINMSGEQKSVITTRFGSYKRKKTDDTDNISESRLWDL